MSLFLLEIGCEEIPAHFMPDILTQMEQKAQQLFEESRLSHGPIKACGTPRRIVLQVEDVAERQRDLEEIIKGPAQKVAYDQEGNPTKALKGFMRSQSVDENALMVQELNGVPYIYARKVQAGLTAREVLEGLGPSLILSLTFPKTMRWADKGMRFVRPIRWIVALLDDEVVTFEIDGIISGRSTRGHRFLGQADVSISDASEYVSIMERQGVIVDPERRRQMIVQQITMLSNEVHGIAMLDDELLDEVVYLVEYPTALRGSFDSKYLKLPQEVVITPMKDHQRYFPVIDSSGALMPYFITIKNGGAEYIDAVRAGNEKVLKARLADAQFFYEEDLKTLLKDRVEKLKGIIFHDGLGNLYEKTERLRELSRYIAERLSLTDDILTQLDRAAYLSRADLTTDMVNEFDELQGVMGREYAIIQGESKAVAQAIYEMYLPKGANDELPQSVIGAVLGIADKLDTLCGYFSIGLQPTGSQDPYGLRRQALGICRIIYRWKLKLSLNDLISFSAAIYGLKDNDGKSEVCRDVLNFIKQRVRTMLLDEGLPYDAIDAAMAVNFDDLLDVKERASVIAQWKRRLDFEELMTAFNRPNNLSLKTDNLFVDEKLFVLLEEENLWNVCKCAKSELDAALIRGDYDQAFIILKNMKPAIDRFFDAVMVMVDDSKIRANRLAVLKNVADLFKRIGDLAQILI